MKKRISRYLMKIAFKLDKELFAKYIKMTNHSHSSISNSSIASRKIKNMNNVRK